MKGSGTNFLSVLDFEPGELEECLGLAERLKRDRALGPNAPTAGALKGAHVALVFEKPSLRTRVTFEIAVRELGGEVVLMVGDVAFGGREPIADVARNLERWVKAAVIRTFDQAILLEFERVAPRLHVVNALTDQEHPCQALADVMTLKECWGDWRGRTVAFLGDGNNVATSLVHACMMLGVHVNVASPDGYTLRARVTEAAARVARHGAGLRLFRDPHDAVRGANAVYTDVWTSMGQEGQTERKTGVFAPYQVTADLMREAAPGAVFLHCLPAHRGEEVTEEVIESPRSVVFDQAENRLHTHKAVLLTLMQH
jgi:ornithine carbamoyltransferase